MGELLAVYIIFIVLVFLGILAIDVLPYLRKNEEYPKSRRFNPKVLVIVPCRGIDLTLEENLKSIKRQDYKGYKVVAVVDSRNDPAVKHIKKLKIDLLVSNYSAERASGKVKAILTALKLYHDFDVYVIADSDILVRNNWLKELMTPLTSNKIGLSTAYPKFIPKGGFWSKVKSIWSFVGEGLMESKTTRFGWGGSLAFRSDLMDSEAIEMLADSKYSVSDDICLTKIARSKGLEIAYESRSQPEVYSDDSFAEFVEWSNRQTALTILGYRKNLYYGIAFYSAEILLMLSGILLSYFVSTVFLILLLHLAKGEWKTYKRAKSRDYAIFFIVIAIPFLYLGNLIAASGLRKITWRGRVYSLRS